MRMEKGSRERRSEARGRRYKGNTVLESNAKASMNNGMCQKRNRWLKEKR